MSSTIVLGFLSVHLDRSTVFLISANFFFAVTVFNFLFKIVFGYAGINSAIIFCGRVSSAARPCHLTPRVTCYILVLQCFGGLSVDRT